MTHCTSTYIDIVMLKRIYNFLSFALEKLVNFSLIFLYSKLRNEAKLGSDSEIQSSSIYVIHFNVLPENCPFSANLNFCQSELGLELLISSD